MSAPHMEMPKGLVVLYHTLATWASFKAVTGGSSMLLPRGKTWATRLGLGMAPTTRRWACSVVICPLRWGPPYKSMIWTEINSNGFLID